MKENTPHRTKNLIMAILVFAIVTLGFEILSVIFVDGMYLAGGWLLGENADTIYQFFLDHATLFDALLYTMMLLVIGVWYYVAVVEKRGIRSSLRQGRVLDGKNVCWIVLLAFALVQLVGLVFLFFAVLAPDMVEDYNQMVEVGGITQYSLLWIICTLILPPLVEEMAFRGLLMGYLKKAGFPFFLANVVQAICFGIFHMNLIQGIYAAILGLFLGYLAERYHTLLASMLLHASYNFFGTLATDLIESYLPDWIQIVLIPLSVPILIGVMFLIHRQTQSHENRSDTKEGGDQMNPIFTRTSIRSYSDQPVEPEKVEKILRAGMAAPSACNQQPWEFFVVRDPEKIEKLSKSSPYTDFMKDAPLTFIPCYRKDCGHPDYAEIDMSICCENMLLEIEDQGLGGCIMGIAPHRDRMDKVSSVIDLPDHLEVFAMISCGYPKEKKPQEDRFDLSRVHELD